MRLSQKGGLGQSLAEESNPEDRPHRKVGPASDGRGASRGNRGDLAGGESVDPTAHWPGSLTSSTSKVSVALAGILGGKPLAP
jgi:hypothetical protein